MQLKKFPKEKRPEINIGKEKRQGSKENIMKEKEKENEMRSIREKKEE